MFSRVSTEQRWSVVVSKKFRSSNIALEDIENDKGGLYQLKFFLARKKIGRCRPMSPLSKDETRRLGSISFIVI